jgi:hypothetical protein
MGQIQWDMSERQAKADRAIALIPDDLRAADIEETITQMAMSGGWDDVQLDAIRTVWSWKDVQGEIEAYGMLRAMSPSMVSQMKEQLGVNPRSPDHLA